MVEKPLYKLFTISIPPARTRHPCHEVTSLWSNCDFNLDSQWGVCTSQRVRTLAIVHSPHHYSESSLNLPATKSRQIVTEALVGERYGLSTEGQDA